MASILVGTKDFRAAMRSVIVHTGRNPKWPEYSRVRLDIGPENVTLTATDRFTTGLAIVSVMTHLEAELEVLDLTPDDAAKILSLFKAGTETDDEPEYLLRIETDETHVKITDSSGMIDGRSLKLPRQPLEENFPDVARLLSKAHHAPPTILEAMAVNGPLLTRFKDAAAAYKQPLILEANIGWRSIFVRCGDSFLGTVSPAQVDDALNKGWASDWTRRLPDPNTEPEKDGSADA
ncbi:hypothetical protein [Cellulomonas sp. NPDC058312]|uniref:hypothetical protein n=1 Tax=Cellulomonas sp. NPDC058312 TaxID=3346441 RepID=UPI0036F10D02